MKTENIERTKDVALDAMQPIIDWTRETRGGLSDLHRRVNERLKKEVPRTQFERYFAHDREKRVEPGLGVGLLILDAWKAIQRTKEFREKNSSRLPD